MESDAQMFAAFDTTIACQEWKIILAETFAKTRQNFSAFCSNKKQMKETLTRFYVTRFHNLVGNVSQTHVGNHKINPRTPRCLCDVPEMKPRCGTFSLHVFIFSKQALS